MTVKKKKTKISVYLDNAAATPLDPFVFKAMKPFLQERFGNPSSLYKEGVVAREGVESARKTIAGLLHAQTDEIIFTGSGTESDNLAIQGVVQASLKTIPKPHVITSVIEHAAVLETITSLEKQGRIEVSYVPVGENGVVDAREVKKALCKNTVLVSIMYANSEIGTIQPIRDIVRTVSEFRGSRGVAYPYVHTDACQAMNYVETSVEKLGVDLMTFNGSKIYGPKGVGVLYVRKGVAIEPFIYGGGQERGLRSGTENVAGIVGMAKALEIIEKLKEKESVRLTKLREYFFQKLSERIPSVTVNGDRLLRLPNNVHVTIPEIEDDVLVLELDAQGVSCSSKSACKTSVGGASHVILAIDGAKGSSLRFSLGRHTTKKDIDYTVKTLSVILEKYKKLSTF